MLPLPRSVTTTIADDDGGLQAALQSIAQDLTAEGLLYANSTSTVGTCVTVWGSAFFWSASPQPSGSGPWDVKASIDTDMIDQCVENRTLTLKSYQCSLDAPSLQWIINITAAAQTIQQWTMGIYGALMDDPSAPANETLSSLLDVLTMVSHGGRVQTKDRAWGDPSIGCLADMAAMPALVFTLLLLATIAGTSMVAFWLTLFFSLRHTTFGLSLGTLRSLQARTPNNLVGWMKFALWREGSLGWVEKRMGRCNLAINGEYEVVFEDERQQGGNGLLKGKDMKRTGEVRETYAGFR
jgi:hypothetical protein